MIFCLVLNTKQVLEYHRKFDKIPTYLYLYCTNFLNRFHLTLSLN